MLATLAGRPGWPAIWVGGIHRLADPAACRGSSAAVITGDPGSALGGILAAAGGIVAVTLVDAVTFVASAVLLAFVRTSGRTAVRVPQ